MITASKNQNFNAVALCFLSASATLAGCGGGGGGAPSAATDVQSSSTVAAVDNAATATAQAVDSAAIAAAAAAATTAAATAQAAFDAGTVTPGWAYASGLTLTINTGSSWQFQSEKSGISNPGSYSSVTDTTGSLTHSLQYNFGCGASKIGLRTQDCRNVVAMYANVAGTPDTSTVGAVSMEVRNADASSQLALRITDSSGQTLQYPFSVRSIEAIDPSKWTRVTVPLKNPDVFWGGNNNGTPQGKLSVFAVVASALNSSSATLGLNYPASKVEVRGIEFNNSANSTYKLNTNNPLAAGPFYANYPQRMAVASQTMALSALSKAKQVGFTVVRKDLFWSGVEANGKFNFAEYLGYLKTLDTVNMRVLWILDYTHRDYGSVPPQTTTQIAGFTRYAKEVAKLTATHPKVMGYEVWNEPNIEGFWPTPDATKYGALLKATTTAIRSVDATTPIISGGIAVDEPTYLYKLAQTGALSGVSAIGIHPYRVDTITTASPYRRQANSPESYAEDQAVYKNTLLAGGGPNIPFWNTEWGYSTYKFLDAAVYGDGNSAAAATRQGLLTSRMVLTQLAINAPFITVYNLVDNGTDPTDKEHHFGLLKPDLTEKPAYVGLRTLYQHGGTRTFKGYLTDTPHGTHVLRWDGSTDRTFCLWVDDASKDTTVTLPVRTAKVTRWDGVVLTPATDSAGNKTITLTEAAGPVYVLVQ